jgi:hypothetical protein
VKIGDKVIVVGGGNSAIDAARVARRLGKDTRILYRRTKAEMPAIKSEIEEAIVEGIDIQFLAAPTKVMSSNGKIEAVECINMELGDIDASGRRRPVPIQGSEFNVDVDTLILAISQEPDVSLLNGNKLNVSKWNTLEVDPETLLTNVEGIFAGGDVITGPNTVTEAMAHGKVAAQMIDKYIRGEKLERKYEVTRPALHVEPVQLSEEEVKSLKKPGMPSAPVAQRIENFEEVELGYKEADAITEAKRCLRCDLEKKEDEVPPEEKAEEVESAEKEVVEEKPEEKAAEPLVAAVTEAAPEEKPEEPAAEAVAPEEKVVEKVEEPAAEEEKVEEKAAEPAPEPQAEPEAKKIKAAIEIPEIKAAIEIPAMKKEEPVAAAEVKKEEEKVEEKAEEKEEAAVPEKKEEPEKKKIKAAIEIPEIKAVVDIPEMKKEGEVAPEEKIEEKAEEPVVAKPAPEQKKEPEEKKAKAVIEIPEIKAVIEIPEMKKEKQEEKTEKEKEEKK